MQPPVHRQREPSQPRLLAAHKAKKKKTASHGSQTGPATKKEPHTKQGALRRSLSHEGKHIGQSKAAEQMHPMVDKSMPA
jgi:hypothetical protein